MTNQLCSHLTMMTAAFEFFVPFPSSSKFDIPNARALIVSRSKWLLLKRQISIQLNNS